MKTQDYIELLRSTIDLNKLIEIRTKFKSEFPEDFKKYMEILNEKRNNPWNGCLDCKFYQSGCTKDERPQPLRKTTDKAEYFCSSFQKKG